MSLETVTKTEFKARALEYFRQVESTGKRVVITDRGQPTIEIRRYRNDHRSPLEVLEGSVVEYKDPTGPVADDDWEIGASLNQLHRTDTDLIEENIMADQLVIAWQVEFDDGSIELWPAKDVQGTPAFGRWVTPLVAGSSAVDQAPETSE